MTELSMQEYETISTFEQITAVRDKSWADYRKHFASEEEACEAINNPKIISLEIEAAADHYKWASDHVYLWPKE